jgi:hypothetical protein
MADERWEGNRMRAGLPRDVSFATALLLYGWDVAQTSTYYDESRAQIDDAWERPVVERAGSNALWDRDAAWLAEMRRVAVPWATEVLALPYVYQLAVRA